MIKTIYWVSSSHWDREWHRSYEGFRCRLTDMLDRTIDCLLHHPAYGCFFLDGQSIILRDYLETRPDMERTIRQLIRREKLFAGPFYVLQDEMIVPGELLARNLQRGIQVARAYGIRKFVGWTPDSFGHCAQLPQLLRLAGVSSALFCRGLGRRGRQQENLWAAPDGSTVFLIWMPLCYGGFCHEDGLADNRHIPEDRQAALRLFENRLAPLKPYVKGGAALVMDGGDHLYPDLNAVRLQADFNAKHHGRPQFRIASIIEAVAEIQKFRRPHRVAGEMRHFGKTSIDWILPGTYTTRMPLKHGLAVNTRALLALEQLATLQPFSPGLHANIERAWDLLLQNTAHDSIGGCHVDEVYLDNLSRLNAVQSIVAHAQERLLESFRPPERKTGRALEAVIFDPAPQAGRWKPFVLECPYGKIQNPSRVQLFERGLEALVSKVERYQTHQSHIHTYRISGVYRLSEPTHLFNLQLTEGKENHPAWKEGPLAFQSQRYGLRFDRRGSFSLRDRQSARLFGPLFRLVDQGDAGDTYNYSPAARDRQRFVSASAAAFRVQRLRADWINAEVILHFRVPAGLEASRQRRRRQLMEMKIRYHISADLEAGIVRVNGVVSNQAADHRLRAVFATPERPAHSWAGAPFHIEKRPVTAPPPIAGATERAITDHPYIDFISYGGLTVFSKSPGEYQVTENGIEVTLCRCVGHVGRPDLAFRTCQGGPFYEAPMAQLLATDIPFGFMITPSLPDNAAEHRRKELLWETVTTCVPSAAFQPIRATLPLRVGGAELTSLRWISERRLELRLFNPRPKATTTRLSADRSIRELVEVDLNHERRQKGIRCRDAREVAFTMRPFGILTLIATL